VDRIISLAGTFTPCRHILVGEAILAGAQVRFPIEPTTLLLSIFRPRTVLRASAQPASGP
jgi:hypothetical protein